MGVDGTMENEHESFPEGSSLHTIDVARRKAPPSPLSMTTSPDEWYFARERGLTERVLSVSDDAVWSMLTGEE